MISAVIFFLISTVVCSSGGSGTASEFGNLAFSVPEYAVDGEVSPKSLIFAVTLLLIISFINIKKKSLELFQGQAIVLLGVYLGVYHILYSLAKRADYLGWLIGLGSIVAAIMSYNDEFMSLFMASICAYITTYYTVLISRMEISSQFMAGVLGGVLFFIYITIGRSRNKLLMSVSKAGVTSLGIVALIDTWGFPELLKGMHGVNDTTGLLYGFLIGGTIILVSFITVFVINYYPEWTEEKVNKLRSSS